jgi:hypothetical protein
LKVAKRFVCSSASSHAQLLIFRLLLADLPITSFTSLLTSTVYLLALQHTYLSASRRTKQQLLLLPHNSATELLPEHFYSLQNRTAQQRIAVSALGSRKAAAAMRGPGPGPDYYHDRQRGYGGPRGGPYGGAPGPRGYGPPGPYGNRGGPFMGPPMGELTAAAAAAGIVAGMQHGLWTCTGRVLNVGVAY